MYLEENKIFSESAEVVSQLENKQYSEMLRNSSASEDDLANRQEVYSKVMTQFEELREAYRAFSGYAEIPILSNQYFNATMASYVRSFAGFLTIERAMDQPTALLWFNDLLGVVDRRVVLPNLGKENLKGINARFNTQAPLVVGQATYEISTNKKLIPGSVEINLVHALEPNKVFTIKDDRNGNLLAPAGILAKNDNDKISVNYATGLITFKVGDGFTIAANDSYSIIGYEDVAGDPAYGQLTGPGNNRFTVDMKNIVVTSEPDMLVGENNLMAMAAAKKSISMDPQEVVGQKLTELYTKLVNGKLTDGIINNAQGNAVVIPMQRYMTQFTDYNSRLDAFQADLVNVDTAMAKSTMKATKATAYLVGEGTGNWFRKLRNTGNWTDNTESTYINDLLGYFNGIPVLRHTSVGHNTGYAIHKTPGGELAPLMRGIYLPLTNMPIVGNYNNPSQFATGVYYQEANEIIMPELIQEFTIEE